LIAWPKVKAKDEIIIVFDPDAADGPGNSVTASEGIASYSSRDDACAPSWAR
jgi:hypothetical protein